MPKQRVCGSLRHGVYAPRCKFRLLSTNLHPRQHINLQVLFSLFLQIFLGTDISNTRLYFALFRLWAKIKQLRHRICSQLFAIRRIDYHQRSYSWAKTTHSRLLTTSELEPKTASRSFKSVSSTVSSSDTPTWQHNTRSGCTTTISARHCFIYIWLWRAPPIECTEWPFYRNMDACVKYHKRIVVEVCVEIQKDRKSCDKSVTAGRHFTPEISQHNNNTTQVAPQHKGNSRYIVLKESVWLVGGCLYLIICARN